MAAQAGAVVWKCVDYKGRKLDVTLDGSRAVLMPPGILHTYEGLADGSKLQVICNTLFVPEDPETHDSYNIAAFEQIAA